ncbi:MAG TPA: HAMP domain-containing sensor histidine kinase [Steroidobacteraceae bacterium]
MSANLLEIHRPWGNTRLRAHAFKLCFAVPAALIAIYATVISDQTHAWRTATICWVLTALVIGLVMGVASMIEQCEREANQNGGLSTSLPVWRRSPSQRRTANGAQERIAHLENVIVRQHRFVNDAAHELRTPLTAQSLVGAGVLARESATSTELREAIVSMLEESKHMKRLIEGLLDLTRAALTHTSGGGVSRQPVALDLSALARDCVESLQVLAEEKQQSIKANVAADVLADADLTMVRQALLNVIHNSVQHCPEGTHIQVDTLNCPPNEVLIRVQDDGPGIPLEEQGYVFERFYRGAGSSRQRGLGLGLSIAKAILCSQGGGIELRSTPGSGCSFLMRLPRATRHRGCA